MISSPSLCDAASTRSASWAGCRRASLGWGMRRRTLGTCPVNASTLAQSRNSVETMLAPRRRGATRRRMPRSPVSTPTTRYQPSMRAISISFARTSRAPSMLISWRSRTSFFSSTSPGRRSNRCRSIFSACRSTRPCADLGHLVGGDEHRPPGHRGQHPRDGRVVLAEPHQQVVDLAQALAVSVAQHPADDQREMQDGGCGRGVDDENVVPDTTGGRLSPFVIQATCLRT